VGLRKAFGSVAATGIGLGLVAAGFVGCAATAPSPPADTTAAAPQPPVATAAVPTPSATPVPDTPSAGDAPPASQPGTATPVPAPITTDEAVEAEPEEDAVPAPDPAADALAAYEEAMAAYQHGDLEAALDHLDDAYRAMLEIPEDGAPELLEQRENLRVLVARLVLEIEAGEAAAANGNGSSIPVEVNEHVARELASFQGPEREFFLASYRRSGRYRPMIVEKLRAAGLPEELSWLPLIESGFKTRAYSRARALGLWQFIASTGYRFGLARNRFVDERLDPEKSTDAAIRYLSHLHAIFGDWLTALAAYNCGERTVLRGIEHQSTEYLDSFWDLYLRLPGETRRYVPRFIATLRIVSDPGGYGFELPKPDDPPQVAVVTVTKSVALKKLDAALGLPSGTLAELNPELRLKATPPSAYALRVPASVEAIVPEKVAALPVWSPPRPKWVTHRVRRGETLSSIAHRYRTSVRSIQRLNGLRNPNRLRIGQRLKVPVGRTWSGSASGASGRSSGTGRGRIVRYRVRRGDTLWRIARRFGTTVSSIRRLNGLRGNTIRVGQVLKVESRRR